MYKTQFIGFYWTDSPASTVGSDVMMHTVANLSWRVLKNVNKGKGRWLPGHKRQDGEGGAFVSHFSV